MNYRHATPKDMLQIAALDRDVWRSNHAPDFIPDGEHAWRIWIDIAFVCVAEENDHILGCSLAFPGFDDSLYLHKLFVAEAHHGKGFGKKLLEETVHFCDKIGKPVWLTVDPKNQKAISLYEQFDFKITSHVEGFYRQEEARFIMRRTPNQSAQ